MVLHAHHNCAHNLYLVAPAPLGAGLPLTGVDYGKECARTTKRGLISLMYILSREGVKVPLMEKVLTPLGK